MFMSNLSKVAGSQGTPANVLNCLGRAEGRKAQGRESRPGPTVPVPVQSTHRNGQGILCALGAALQIRTASTSHRIAWVFGERFSAEKPCRASAGRRVKGGSRSRLPKSTTVRLIAVTGLVVPAFLFSLFRPPVQHLNLPSGPLPR